MQDPAPTPTNHPDLEQARATLTELAAGDAGELAELIAIIRESLATGADNLAAAALAEDRKQVHFHGHTLKGALRTAGMELLAALVETVELGAARLAAPELRTRAAEIQARVAAVVRGLAS